MDTNTNRNDIDTGREASQSNQQNCQGRKRKHSYWTLWMSFVGSVAVLATALSVYFGISLDKERKLDAHSDGYYQQQLTNVYKQSLFRLSDGLENTDVVLGKMLISNDSALLNKLLVEAAGLADGAVGDVATLPMEQQTVAAATRYFNQLSDYCKSIADDISLNNALTDEQKGSIGELRMIAKTLKTSVAAACLNDDGFEWQAANDGTNTANISFSLEDVDENTFDYPQLVYDGPFSDSVAKKTFEVEEISSDDVAQKLAEDFADFNVSDINFVAEIDNKAKVYSFNLRLNGKQYYVETAKNGMVAQLNASGEDFENDTQSAAAQSDIDEDACCTAAEKMAQALGYDVKPMWVSQTIDDRVYVNMVAKQNGITIYPDMVKMAIDANSGEVVGIDAFGYIANHKQRCIPKSFASAQQAKAVLSDKVEVNGYSTCIVPDGSEEKFCYEFRCSANGEDYLIYVDAVEKTEVEILQIIEDEMGYTVM